MYVFCQRTLRPADVRDCRGLTLSTLDRERLSEGPTKIQLSHATGSIRESSTALYRRIAQEAETLTGP
jgi:hypothetical protein